MPTAKKDDEVLGLFIEREGNANKVTMTLENAENYHVVSVVAYCGISSSMVIIVTVQFQRVPLHIWSKRLLIFFEYVFGLRFTFEVSNKIPFVLL